MVNFNVLDYIFSKVNIPQNAKVLDVGCNNSKTLVYLKNKFCLNGELIGIDKKINQFENDDEQKKFGITLTQMNASEPFKFPDEYFDFIFHKDTLECITNIDAHIKDLHRVLKKDGTIVCVHRDWESIVVNGSNKQLINKVVYGYANYLQNSWMDACDGWMGRRIWGYFNKTDLFDGNIDCYNVIETKYIENTTGYRYINEMNFFLEPNGFLTESEYNELLDDIQQTYDKKQYIFSMPYYIYVGKKM